MPKLSAKRQVTLPIATCNQLNIKEGDDVEIFVFKEQINIVKKKVGAAAGILKDIPVNSAVSDRESMVGHFE